MCSTFKSFLCLSILESLPDETQPVALNTEGLCLFSGDFSKVKYKFSIPLPSFVIFLLEGDLIEGEGVKNISDEPVSPIVFISEVVGKGSIIFDVDGKGAIICYVDGKGSIILLTVQVYFYIKCSFQ